MPGPVFAKISSRENKVIYSILHRTLKGKTKQKSYFLPWTKLLINILKQFSTSLCIYAPNYKTNAIMWWRCHLVCQDVFIRSLKDIQSYLIKSVCILPEDRWLLQNIVVESTHICKLTSTLNCLQFGIQDLSLVGRGLWTLSTGGGGGGVEIIERVDGRSVKSF